MGQYDFFYDLAPTLVEPTTDDPLQFKRKTLTYNPLTGTETEVVQTVDIHSTPPLQWTEEELADDTIRKTDTKVIVANKSMDAAGLELKPGTEELVYCTYKNKQYKVLPVKRVASGDKEAILILGLRR